MIKAKKITIEKIKKGLLENNLKLKEVKILPEVEKSLCKAGIECDYNPTSRDKIWWKIEKIIGFPSDAWENIKAFYQRGTRGYADRDCWGIDWYICSWIPSALRTMVNKEKGGGNSYPGKPWGKEADTFDHWQATIEKIAVGFEAHQQVANFEYENDKEKIKLLKIRDEGMALFIKYFDHLWD